MGCFGKHLEALRIECGVPQTSSSRTQVPAAGAQFRDSRNTAIKRLQLSLNCQVTGKGTAPWSLNRRIKDRGSDQVLGSRGQSPVAPETANCYANYVQNCKPGDFSLDG